MNSKKKPCLVVKFGTATLTDSDGTINFKQIENLSNQLAELSLTYSIILVSSGAVGSGKVYMKNYSGSINDRKAAAAIGNPLLIQAYSNYFAKHNIQVAQCLLERKHFSNRREFEQLKQTISTIWNNDIIPIANENDVVNDLELRFSDNDELATRLSIAFDAKKLLIGSSVNGLLNKENITIPYVAEINQEIFEMVKPEKSSQGLGGMSSKLTFAKLACSLGVETTIFNAKLENAVIKALNNQSGTTFIAKEKSLSNNQKWIASAGLSIGKLIVDDGAKAALLERKSLLAVGIKKVKADFQKGEIIEILDTNKDLIAVAKSKLNSIEIDFETKGLEIAHANEIILI